jgi:hypothetical protein
VGVKPGLIGQRFRMSENRVLRRIFGPKRDEVRVGWRKLRNGELHNLYSSLDIRRIIKLCSALGEMRNTYRILVEGSEGKRPLSRPRPRWRLILNWILRK